MLMLVDRGADHDIRAGQRMTIFGQTMAGHGPATDVGTATVCNVRPQTSLVRIAATHDALFVGDMVALYR